MILDYLKRLRAHPERNRTNSKELERQGRVIKKLQHDNEKLEDDVDDLQQGVKQLRKDVKKLREQLEELQQPEGSGDRDTFIW